jgi:hypothetical protein
MLVITDRPRGLTWIVRWLDVKMAEAEISLWLRMSYSLSRSGFRYLVMYDS